MRVIYVGEKPHDRSVPSVFLAGPSPRDGRGYNWRPEALDLFQAKGFCGDVFVPLTRDAGWLGDKVAQWNWELAHLERAYIIAFWVPRDLKMLPGFTTNVEFGMYVASGKAVLGYPQSAPKTAYLNHLACRHKVPVVHTLEDLTEKVLERMPECVKMSHEQP